MKKTGTTSGPRIQHQQILQESGGYGRLIDTYRQKVLTQKTRTIRLLGRKTSAQVIHTLLGYEVQASYKRIQCPDLVTARYLCLFSELGCHSIKLPYDPTLTEQLIPEFEATIDGIKERIRGIFPHDSRSQLYATRRVYALLRRHLAATAQAKAAGASIPRDV